MGSLTVLAGLMFTLGTRPVNAQWPSKKSPTVKTFEDEKKKLMDKADKKGLKDKFKNKIDSLDDYYKLRTLEEEIEVAESGKTAKSEFETKLEDVERRIENLPESKNKTKIKDGLDYLKKMNDDRWFTTNEKNSKLADLEKCLQTPRHVKKLNWIR